MRLVAESEPDIVIHLAGVIGQPVDVDGRALLFAVNAGATRHLLEALDRHATRTGRRPCLVLASTGLVYGSQQGPWSETYPTLATDPYSLSKLEAEGVLGRIVARGRVGGIVLRPGLLYGPEQKGGMFLPSLCAALAEGRRFPMTLGVQRRDFLHVDDFVAATVSVLEHLDALAGDPLKSPWIGNVGTGVGSTLRDVAEAAVRIGSELWPDCGSIDPGAVPYRNDESWDYRLRPGRLMASTGWLPSIQLHDGIRQCLLAARERVASTGDQL